MTHEYVIALGGRVGGHGFDQGEAWPSAVAWAADRVLAVGADDVVRSLSRGDSTFLDISGCVVTALPDDSARAVALVNEMALSAPPETDIEALLIEAGLLDQDSALEPGSPANLAFWDVGSGWDGSRGPQDGGLVAVVRDGGFTEGDEHRGPFPAASSA